MEHHLEYPVENVPYTRPPIYHTPRTLYITYSLYSAVSYCTGTVVTACMRQRRKVASRECHWQKAGREKTTTSTSTCRTLNSFAFVMPLRRCGDCQAFALLSICNSVEHHSGKCTTNVRSYDMSTLYYIMLYEIIRQWIIALFFSS